MRSAEADRFARPKALAPAAAADIDDVDAVDKIDWSKARFLGRGLYARKLRLALPLAGLRDAAKHELHGVPGAGDGNRDLHPHAR